MKREIFNIGDMVEYEDKPYTIVRIEPRLPLVHPTYYIIRDEQGDEIKVAHSWVRKNHLTNNKDMENIQINDIDVPEGYIAVWNKDNTKVKIIKRGELTYEEISHRLFDKGYFYTNDIGKILENPTKESSFVDTGMLNISTNKIQLKKMLAFNKLMNIAEYLNEGWTPDWRDDDQKKWMIYYGNYGKYDTISNCSANNGVVYFKTEELAKQAITIMGDDIDILFKN